MSDKIQILLDTADQIEKSSFYSGIHWWHNYDILHRDLPIQEKGCAMTRILINHGAIIDKENNESVVLKKDGKYFDGFSFSHKIKELTDIDRSFWDFQFQLWSLTASKEDTVKVLRLLGNKEYDFSETIVNNLNRVNT